MITKMTAQPTKNLVFFCGNRSLVPIKIIDTIRQQINTHSLAINISAIIGNADGQPQNQPGSQQTIVEYAQAQQIPFVRLVKGVANNPIFIEELFKRYKPDWAMSLYCTEIFSQNFINHFEQVLNYHNGALPQYKGVHATHWAIANGESHAGWRFHRVTKALDGGNILLGGSVEILTDDTPAELETKLLEQACVTIPEFLQKLLKNDSGEKQTGPSSYYSHKDSQRAGILPNPSDLTAQQLLNRVQAFSPVLVTLAQRNLTIKQARLIGTKNDKVNENKKSHHRITSSDGFIIELIEAEATE